MSISHPKTLFRRNMRTAIMTGVGASLLAFFTMFGMKKHLEKTGLKEDIGAETAAWALCLTAGALAAPVGYSMLSARNKKGVGNSLYDVALQEQDVLAKAFLQSTPTLALCNLGVILGSSAASAPDGWQTGVALVADSALLALNAGFLHGLAAKENTEYLQEKHKLSLR